MAHFTTILGMTACYFAFILALVVYARWKETKSLLPSLNEFFLAGKNLHPAILAGTFAASYFSTWTVLGLPGMLYAQGIGALYFVFVLDILGVAVLFWLGPRIRRFARENKIFSPVEIVSLSYQSRALGLCVAVLFMIFLMPYISLQLVGVGAFIEGYTNGQISYLLGVGSMMVIVLIYLLLGGMRAVAYTDIIQMLAIIIGMGFGMFYLIDHYDLSFAGLVSQSLMTGPDILTIPGPMGIWTLPMILTVGLVSLGIHFQPHILTRSMMARSKKDFHILIASLLGARLVVSFFTIGFALAAYHIFSDDLAPNMMMGRIFDIMASMGTAGLVLSGLMLMGALGAAMSTADSLLISIGQVATRDVVRPFLKMRQKKQVLLSKLIMFLVLLFAFLMGFNPPKFMVDMGVYSGAGCALLIPTIACFTWRHRNTAAAFVSIISGLICLSAFAVYKLQTGDNPFGVHVGFFPIMVSFLSYFGICFAAMMKKKKTDTEETYA